jgi:hypothetical protein
MISDIPKSCTDFLSEQLFGYAARGYKIILHPSAKITTGAMTYTGEATAERLEIAVGGDWKDWIGILVHETCHLDQHIEDPSTFVRADDSLKRISDWLERKTDACEVHDFREILQLERDCEERALRKMHDFNLPVDTKDYAQRANAYLASYGPALRHRAWIPQPYRSDSICSRMPSDKILGVDEVLRGEGVVPDADFLRLTRDD